MLAAQIFVNIAQLTNMKLEIPRPPHSPIAEPSLPLEVLTISSAWRVQPYWGQASSRKQYRCGRHWSFKHYKITSNVLVFNLSPTSR